MSEQGSSGVSQEQSLRYRGVRDLAESVARNHCVPGRSRLDPKTLLMFGPPTVTVVACGDKGAAVSGSKLGRHIGSR